ncbi:MAG TPA: prolipoprotein diacylglyceryl transferase family protein [Labilithrix sp.]
MLPFVFLDESKLGPFHAFGLCCAAGFFLWDWAFMKRGLARGYARGDLRALTAWLLVTGTFVAWLVDVVFYHSGDRAIDSSVSAWQGFSATGGFVGALIGALAWTRVFVGRDADTRRFVVRLRKEPQALLRASDVIVSTWTVAAACGRLGCSLIHDHPGVTVAKGSLASFLAVGWPRGPEEGVSHVLGPLHVVTGAAEARLDLGLLECLFFVVLSIVFVATWKRELKLGTYTIAGTIAYGTFRLLLDFARITDGPGGDVRHGGLTFAQYVGLAMIALGVTLFVRRMRSAPAPAGATS